MLLLRLQAHRVPAKILQESAGDCYFCHSLSIALGCHPLDQLCKEVCGVRAQQELRGLGADVPVQVVSEDADQWLEVDYLIIYCLPPHKALLSWMIKSD